MGALANPYVLLVMIAVGAGYAVTEKVKEPVKIAAHAVKEGAKKTGHGIIHVITFGKK